jgi:hypothetical protein
VLGCVFGSCSHGEASLLEGGGTLARYLRQGADRDVESGALDIARVPLPVRARRPRGRGGRTWRPAQEGCVLRYPHRIALDGAVYRRAVRRGGGSILVDVSASMRMTAADLEAILASAPGISTVAIYASSDGERGELRIVARGGWRAAAEDLEPPGVGNVVDIPCLEWLMTQPGPRCWVSDGGVTGVGDRFSELLRLRSEDLCRRGRIHRAPDPAQAVAWLGGRG